MTPDAVFRAANTTALVSWILLATLPRQAWVQRLVGSIVPLALAVAYVALVVVFFGSSDGSFNSLSGVATLFANRWVLLAGWIHYLAFDLLTGVWETRDAATRGISRWLLVPCLFFTFMFGPAGWLLYRIVRATRGAPAAQA